MQNNFSDPTIQKAIDAAEKGYIHSAQVLLQEASENFNTPELHTYLAFCLAKGEGRVHSAARACRESIKREPENSLHYLILGRILLMTGEKSKAIDTFRQGLKTSSDPKIISELKKLGLRKPVMIKNLSRTHPLNKMLGQAFSSIGLR